MLFFKKKKTLGMLKDDFFNNLIMLDYVKDKNKINKLIKANKEIASKIPSLNGWPYDCSKFWDMASFGWERKIDSDVRKAIVNQLKGLKGLNLDIGSGSYTYVKNSVFLDASFFMLKELDGLRVCFEFKDKLPFKNNSFDSVTMVFFLNYISDLDSLFKEIERVLKSKGKLVIIQPIVSTGDELYKIQEKKHYSLEEIGKYIKFKSCVKKIGKKGFVVIKSKF